MSKKCCNFATEFTPKPFLCGGWWWVLYILMAFIDALYLTHKKLSTLFYKFSQKQSKQ